MSYLRTQVPGIVLGLALGFGAGQVVSILHLGGRFEDAVRWVVILAVTGAANLGWAAYVRHEGWDDEW